MSTNVLFLFQIVTNFYITEFNNKISVVWLFTKTVLMSVFFMSLITWRNCHE